MLSEKLEDRIHSFREWINHDINYAISNGSNLLAALGLSVYTEYLGGLYRRNHGKKESEENFNVGFSKLGKEYEILKITYEKSGDFSVYSRIRCGLVHEYFIKKRAVVDIKTEPNGLCAIVIDGEKSIFYLKQYRDDFKKAQEEYIAKLFYQPDLADYFIDTWRANPSPRTGMRAQYDVVEGVNNTASGFSGKSINWSR